MNPKRKNKLDKAKTNHIHGYSPVFSPDFQKDLAWWYRNEPKKGDKILDLVADILDSVIAAPVGWVALSLNPTPKAAYEQLYTLPPPKKVSYATI